MSEANLGEEFALSVVAQISPKHTVQLLPRPATYVAVRPLLVNEEGEAATLPSSLVRRGGVSAANLGEELDSAL